MAPPATRNRPAWKTLVHTTAFTPPAAMYRIETTVKTAIVGMSGQPRSTDTASAAAMRRTPDPASRVTKKKIEPVTWLAIPNRIARNS